MQIVKQVTRLESLWKAMSTRVEELNAKFEKLERKIVEHEARLDVNEHYVSETEDKINTKSKELEDKVVLFNNEMVAETKTDRNNHEKEIISLRKQLESVSTKIVKIDKDIVILDEQSKKVNESMKKVTLKPKHKEHQLTCDHCDEKFQSHNSLEMHLENLHMTKQFKCNKCEILFHTKWRLIKHNQIHQATTKKRNCHYFNAGQNCPFERLGCKFVHQYSENCKLGLNCRFHMCHFKHC